MIKFDFNTYMKELPIRNYDDRIDAIKETLLNGGEMLDWYDLDKCISNAELNKLKETSSYIKSNCDVFIVIGIGGSFLGAKAVIDALNPYFEKNAPEIIFTGTSLSSEYMSSLIEYIKDKKVIINVISKSGTTLEPSISFDLLFEVMKEKYNPDELRTRIIITTDKETGNLRPLVNEAGYTSFEVPEQIGGRYSVLTAVGLLPIAVAGYDIDELFDGAKACNIEAAFKYAVIRDILYNEGKKLESFTVYEPKLGFFAEWLKQLFGETQGKEEKGVFPVSVINTRDLHSLGQYYQDGERIIFETVLSVKNTSDLKVSKYNRTLDDINVIAAEKTALAHFNDGVYSNFISIDQINEFSLGYLIYFFEVAAATGGYLLDINPFDQPGVSAYKNLIDNELKS